MLWLIVGLGAALLFFIYLQWQNAEKVKQAALALQEIKKKERTLHEALSLSQHQLESAILDPVTQLIGWSFFEDRLHQCIEESARFQTIMAVLFIDINDFNFVNTAWGFSNGNVLLTEVAKRLQSCIRKVDSISRYHKDIFVILLDHLNKPESVGIVVQRLLQAIALPFELEQQAVNLTISIGIAIYPADGDSGLVLLRNAEQALQKAKDKGRQTYQFYEEELYRRSERELKLMTGLWREKIVDEIEMRFQPIMNVQTNSIMAIDVFLSWQHPELGYISQQELYQYAEKHGKLNELSLSLLHRACKQFLSWRENDTLALAIPVSLKQLEQKHFIYELARVMQACGFNPECLILEIKDIIEPISFDVLEKTFNMLHYLNVKLAIDHFGEAPFSLRYFKYLKVHFLKLDTKWAQDIIYPETNVLVKAVCFLATQLSTQLIAQGIETQEQIDAFKGAGCILMQGNGLFAPLTDEEMIRKMTLSS